MFSQTTRIGMVVAAAALLAACSASPSSPQVASLGATTTTTAPAGGGPSGSDQMAKNALEFSACMRQHGVKNFPDPQISGNGVQIRIGGSSGLNPRDPTFQSAQQACQKYMRAGIAPGGAKADPTKISAWAACMRSHGLPHFPDPTVNSGSGALQLNMTGTGIDPQGNAFQNAMKACQSLSPGGGLMMQNGNPGGGQ